MLYWKNSTKDATEQRASQTFSDDCIVEEEEKHLSTQFQQMQNNQLIDLQEQFERYCNVLPVF